MKIVNKTVGVIVACVLGVSPWLGAEDVNQTRTATAGQSWLTPSIWDNNSAATSGNNYFTNGYTLRTPDNPLGSATFLGDALTINGGDGGSSGGLSLKSGTTTIGNLYLLSGRISNNNAGSSGNLPATLNVMNFTVGADTTSDNPAIIQGSFTGHDITLNISNLLGGGYLQFTNNRVYTFSVENGLGFNGTIDYAQGSLILEGSMNLANAQLIVNSGVNSVVINNSVSVKSLLFGGVNLDLGNYTSTDLNAFFDADVFSGEGSIAIVPEASTYVLLMSALVLLLTFGKRKLQK